MQQQQQQPGRQPYIIAAGGVACIASIAAFWALALSSSSLLGASLEGDPARPLEQLAGAEPRTPSAPSAEASREVAAAAGAVVSSTTAAAGSTTWAQPARSAATEPEPARTSRGAPQGKLVTERARTPGHGKTFSPFIPHAAVVLVATTRAARTTVATTAATTVAASTSLAPRADPDEGLIPNILLFNYKVDMLAADRSLNVREQHTKQNVLKTIAAHPRAKVIFYDDQQCALAVTRAHSEVLAHKFHSEQFGPYKSDLCRLAMLWEHGGYYFDNDLEVIQDVRQALAPTVGLASCIELGNSQNVFQAFLAAAPKHPMVQIALRLTAQWYGVQGGRGRRLWVGPQLAGQALREWLGDSGPLRVGMASPRTGGSQGNVYLFQETQALGLYGLRSRPHRGGCCCDIVVGDAVRAIAWSRFVGASEFCN